MKDIEWKLHLVSPPERVYATLDSAAGRESFWAEQAEEAEDGILFAFPNGMRYVGPILRREHNHCYEVMYFGGRATFSLCPDGAGGTDLLLTHRGVSEEDYLETSAGWISVLMAMKGALDFGVDLRNHDPNRTWDEGFVDN